MSTQYTAGCPVAAIRRSCVREPVTPLHTACPCCEPLHHMLRGTLQLAIGSPISVTALTLVSIGSLRQRIRARPAVTSQFAFCSSQANGMRVRACPALQRRSQEQRRQLRTGHHNTNGRDSRCRRSRAGSGLEIEVSHTGRTVPAALHRLAMSHRQGLAGKLPFPNSPAHQHPTTHQLHTRLLVCLQPRPLSTR